MLLLPFRIVQKPVLRVEMTITTAASAPLFAVVGARGIQGRSVIDAIIAGRIPYRVRGLMRDTSRAGDLVKLGVEAVAADADSTESMRKAFEGASTVFAMTTTYWDGWPLPDGVSAAARARLCLG